MRIITLALALTLTACGADDMAQMVAEGEGLEGPRGPKGEKGDKGDKGDQGEIGEVGEAGKDGVNGKDGKDGKDGMIVSSNMWFDPITEETWLIGGKVRESQRACGNGYVVPNMEQLKAAYAHGLFHVASIQQGAWAIDTAYGGTVVQIEYLNGQGADGSVYQGSTDQLVLLCLLKQ